MTQKQLYGIDEAKAKIAQGSRLVLAGDESLLLQLPRGHWVGGTIPYFISEEGGLFTREKIFIFELPECAQSVAIKNYDARSVFNVYKEAPENGFSMIIIPAGSPTHLSFALNAPWYDHFGVRPLVGWISGVALPDLEHVTPKVFDGFTGAVLEDGAVVMHVSLGQGKMAEVGIVNIFEQGDGDTLTFPADSFRVTEVLVNGAQRRFKDYLEEKKLDTRLPLVANCSGAMVNVSFQNVDATTGEVMFYGPVFKGVPYKLAKPVSDYLQSFKAQLAKAGDVSMAFSCSCILNYLYAGLEGQRIEGAIGPITFGEVAYQLVNQTMVYLTIADVPLSEQLRSAVTLKRSYQLLETLMNTIPCPVFYKDLQGRFLGCNQAFVELVHQPKEAIIGTTVFDLLSSEMVALHTAKDQELLAHPGRQIYEWEYTDPDGSPRYGVVHKATFTDFQGKIAGIIGVVLDVTERKRMEEMMRRSEKMSAVGTLAAGVAHEINNPLSVILGFSQGMLQRIVPGDPSEIPVRSIEREALRCKHLVQDLLTFSRTSKADRVPLDLNHTVESALTLVHAQGRLARVEIKTNFADALPHILGNPTQIQQVIINLAKNAMDAMAEGGTLTIRTTLLDDPPLSWIGLGVSDTGSGIPPEALPRIFEPFYTTKPIGQGTGLGLSLIHEIVKKHSGTITVQSRPGQTEFLIKFPVAKPAGKEDR